MLKPGPDLGPSVQAYRSREVSQIARVSLRQLQWWDERNFVSPHLEGRRRVYLPEDVIVIMVTAELRRRGFSLQRIRRVVRVLQREIARRLDTVLRSDSNLLFLTDGKSAYLEDRPERIIELLKKSRQAMFLVSVGDQMKRLAEFQKTLRNRKGARRADNQLTLF
jgi:DNA-binding transcriptional MerR regulator